MTTNQIAYQKLKEEARSNLVKERETNRANLAGEELKRQELSEIGRHNLVSETETERSNRARETESNRSALAKEFEQNRHNVIDESIRASQVANQRDLGYANLFETSRANQASESLKGMQIQSSEGISASDRASRERVANQQLANQFRETIYKEGQSNKRKQAELEVEREKAGMQGVGGLVNSFVKILPWVTK